VTGEGRLAARWQRTATKRFARAAGKRPDEALTPEDWEAYLSTARHTSSRAIKRFFRALPASPRCGYCGAPFAGFGARVVRPFGYRPSVKNPSICINCVELSPPGGLTAEIGVLFADLRGFTTLSERVGPAAARAALQQFYASAEQVFFPAAMIDKVIGDAVMALYIPTLIAATAGDRGAVTPERVAELMVEHARALVAGMRAAAPDIGVGVGVAFGEAFVGHVGDGAVHDFTAVGDVVNTASRLQGAARPGEIVIAANVTALLPAPIGTAESLTLKGKDQQVPIHRVQVH
jgi:adenylate cyclase